MRNLKENKYVLRLVDEWMMHGKIIIAVDYDDTISSWRLQTQAQCDETIEKIKLAREVGAYIVVFTACKEERHPEIMQFCEEKGLLIDTINNNPIDLPYGNQNKIYANIFVDDRAGLEEALEILEFAAYSVRSKRKNINEQTVEF
jgi:hypothetical protein